MALLKRIEQAMAKSPAIQMKSLADIVREVGAYALEGFEFVRDCLTVASDKVHGPPSRAHRRVFEWMSKKQLTLEALQELADEGRLPAKLREDVEKAGGIGALNRHVTGQQLCEALRDIAVERWGLLAQAVLGHWGIYATRDFGEIVFALVNNEVLSKQPTDSIQDFDRVFDFDRAFAGAYRIQLSRKP